MAETSKIEWTDATFNPWMGCTKVSPACDNCYAEISTPMRTQKIGWGAKANRKRTSENNWKQPLRWNRQAESSGIRLKVFCASLADVFDNHKSILQEWRDDLWALIRATPHLDWQLLTKRPQNIKKYLPDDWGDGYPNVWLGTTVEKQEEANRRVPALLGVRAKCFFLSCEPLLEAVDLTAIPMGENYFHDVLGARVWMPEGTNDLKRGWIRDGREYVDLAKGIDWVIVGGESGANARLMHLDWIRSLHDQCARWERPFFFKQWGEWHPWGQILADGRQNLLSFGKDPKKYQHLGNEIYCRAGKKRAGNLLDGKSYQEFPRQLAQ